MARNFNPYATYRGYRARKSEAAGATMWVRVVRGVRFWGRWITAIFVFTAVPAAATPDATRPGATRSPTTTSADSSRWSWQR